MSKCACGIPNRADYYLEAVVTNSDETSDVSTYWCGEHVPNLPEGTHDPQTDPFRFGALADTVEHTFAFDGASDWECIAFSLVDLTGLPQHVTD